MNAPRLLMTTDAVGGVWSYATDLALSLSAAGWKIGLVIMGPQPDTMALAPLAAQPHVTVFPTDLELEWMDPAGRNAVAAEAVLKDIACRFRPDLIHLNSFREAAFDWNAPVVVVAHSCVWSWWQACRGSFPPDPAWLVYRGHAADGLAAADAWVAPTTAFADEIAVTYATSSPGYLIQNGASPVIRKSRKQPFILAAGRLWDEAKNLSALCASAPHWSWPLRVVGPAVAPAGQSILPPLGTVEMLGALSRAEVGSQMQRAGIFVSLARYEPFGLAVLEAAACGCALILSRIKPFEELWTGAAQFVDSDCPREVTQIVNAVCADDRLRRDAQRRALERSKRYTLARQVEAYQALYQSLGVAIGGARIDSALSLECQA